MNRGAFIAHPDPNPMAHKAGTRVRVRANELSRSKITAWARGRNIRPSTPSRVRIGT